MEEPLSGRGELRVNDEHGDCSYSLNRWAGERDRGDGWLKDGQALLESAFDRGAATLRVEDGRLYSAKVLGLSDGMARITYVLDEG